MFGKRESHELRNIRGYSIEIGEKKLVITTITIILWIPFLLFHARNSHIVVFLLLMLFSFWLQENNGNAFINSYFLPRYCGGSGTRKFGVILHIWLKIVVGHRRSAYYDSY